MSDSLWPHELQHTRLPCPSPSPTVCINSCPLSRRCHPTTSSSVVLFSCLQSFPASGSFAVSLLFTSGGQSIGASGGSGLRPKGWDWERLWYWHTLSWASLTCGPWSISITFPYLLLISANKQTFPTLQGCALPSSYPIPSRLLQKDLLGQLFEHF